MTIENKPFCDPLTGPPWGLAFDGVAIGWFDTEADMIEAAEVFIDARMAEEDAKTAAQQ